MWVEKDHYSQINTALERRREEILERVLSFILTHPQNSIPVSSGTKITHCPACQKELIHRAVPYVELFVKACPDHHGAWLSSDVSSKLQAFIHEQITIAGQRRYQAKLIKRFFLSLGVFLGISLSLGVGSEFISNMILWNRPAVDENSWPTNRVPAIFKKLQITEQSIQDPRDFGYLQQILVLVEEGINHRINMEEALSLRKSGDYYQRVFDIYEEKQSIVLSEISKMAVPEKLKPFHEHLIKSFYAQINFYADFTATKMEKNSSSIKNMMNHADLHVSNSELVSAWANFTSIFPDMDEKTHQAVYRRLCWLDIL